MVSTCTYRGTRLLTRWAEYSSLDRSRAPERRLRQMAKGLAMAMVIETEMVETVTTTAQRAAAVFTRFE